MKESRASDGHRGSSSSDVGFAKNGQMEKIEQMIFSMQKKYEENLNILREEIAQVQRGSFPLYNPWMGAYQMNNGKQLGSPQFPIGNPYNMPHSSS